MNILNMEIKVREADPGRCEDLLCKLGARFAGIDHQVDTYYIVPSGRLKLREGNIENSLIRYDRKEVKSVKRSEVLLFKLKGESNSLKSILDSLFKRLCVVDKIRKIYYIENVKFHIDELKYLGSFVEIEAIDSDGKRDQKELSEQCQYYMDLFHIDSDQLIDKSYSDMILELPN